MTTTGRGRTCQALVTWTYFPVQLVTLAGMSYRMRKQVRRECRRGQGSPCRGWQGLSIHKAQWGWAAPEQGVQHVEVVHVAAAPVVRQHRHEREQQAHHTVLRIDVMLLYRLEITCYNTKSRTTELMIVAIQSCRTLLLVFSCKLLVKHTLRHLWQTPGDKAQRA